MAMVLPKMQDFGKATATAAVSMDAFNKAITKLSQAKVAASALDAARKAMGDMTSAEKRAAEAANKTAKIRDKESSGGFLGFMAKKTASYNEVDRAQQQAAESAAAEATAIGAVGAVAAAALVAVTALAVGVGALAAKAIEVVEQRAGLLATFSALGGGAAAGKETLAMVDALSEKLPLPASQIQEIAKNMEAAGFRGKALGKAIESVAAATAIMHNASGGAAAQSMLQTLAEGGKGADKMVKAIQEGGPRANKMFQKMGIESKDVTKALREMGVKGKASADQVGQAVEKALMAKGKNPLAEMGATFPVMLAKLQEGFLSLFEGVNIKPFMSALQELFGQFTRGKGPMKALGTVVSQVFSTIFKYAGMAVRAVSAFVKANFTAKNVASTWASVKSAIATVVAVLGKVWSVMKPIVTSPVFLKGLATIFKVIGVVILIVMTVMVAFTATLTILGATVGAVGAALWALAGTLISWAASAVSAGYDFVAGLVNSILNGIGAFVAAVSQMASAGLAAFKSIFKIASPSGVMDQMGGYVAEGAAQGVEGGQSRVEGAATKLGAGMAGASAKGATGAGGKSAGKGGASVTIAAGAVVINAGGATITDEGLAIALERLLVAQGFF